MFAPESMRLQNPQHFLPKDAPVTVTSIFTVLVHRKNADFASAETSVTDQDLSEGVL